MRKGIIISLPNSRVAAFSTVEVLVGMAVTAIILSIVFVIISVTTQRLHDFEMQNEYISDVNRLSYSINKIISESETMMFEEDRLVFESYDGKVTEYNGNDKYFIRADGKFADTFHFPFPKMHIDTLQGKRADMQYQRLNLQIAVQGQQKYGYAFYKKVYICALLKKKEYYEH